ncbi:MAG TPA: DUF1659 domain-containing protein [Syntrophomonadaceae bacterium]|nr:DUF1659 domain-containing protein [Syntrophomonadaceae bacterium]
MAVNATPIASDVALVYNNAGKTVTRRYSDLKVEASDADVFDVVAGVNGFDILQDLTMTSIQRRSTNELEEVI